MIRNNEHTDIWVINKGRPLAEEIARIFLGQINVTIELSKCDFDGIGIAVHEIRKYFKKLRALLRLVCSSMQLDEYNRENKYFRDMGRFIAPIRDSAIHLETWQSFRANAMMDFPSGNSDFIISWLIDNYNKLLDQMVKNEGRLQTLCQNLVVTKEWINTLSHFSPTLEILKLGMISTFYEGKSALFRVKQNPVVENFHEWRKQVKYLMYQLEAIRPIGYGHTDDLFLALDTLSDLLGTDHDMAMLAEKLKEFDKLVTQPQKLTLVLEQLSRLREEKQARCISLGDYLFLTSENMISHCLDV